MCDHSPHCASGGAYELVLRDRTTGCRTTERYCQAHYVARVWELMVDGEIELVDAIAL